MEEPAGTHYDSINTTARKRRSQTCRRPRPDSHVAFVGSHNHSRPMISTPDDVSDDIPVFDANPKRKQFSLSQCMSRAAWLSESQRENHDSRRSRLNNSRRSTEGLLAPANWKNTSQKFQGDDEIYNGRNGENLDLTEPMNEGKVKKVKLKVGGVTRMVHANGRADDGSCRKASRAVDYSRPQGNLDDSNSLQDKKTGTVRKSKRVPKRRVLDGEFSEEDEDDEIRYLEKLKSNAYTICREDDEESGVKQRRPSRVFNAENGGKRKSRLDKASEDVDSEEEDDELVESPVVNMREMTLTSRQRALKSSKDASSSATGSSLIEFPNGLPPAPSRKQKGKLSEVEQQLKKAEAAQRRRLQNEKAARESEAEAIRKILGQDSNRKKREEKMRKRQEELAQEKAAHEQMVASSCIRTVMGPNGTIVTFPENMGFPSLFDPKPTSYPHPREKCVGQSCANPYKYRDSKTKLPLCSLRCYKAVQERLEAETTS